MSQSSDVNAVRNVTAVERTVDASGTPIYVKSYFLLFRSLIPLN